MLVDAGADVNAKHGRTSLTPLLMACNQVHPDVETIRSFFDKGAYPNWRDVQGRSAFDLVMLNQLRVETPAATASRSARGLGSGSGEDYGRESESPGKWRAMDDAIEEVATACIRTFTYT